MGGLVRLVGWAGGWGRSARTPSNHCHMQALLTHSKRCETKDKSGSRERALLDRTMQLLVQSEGYESEGGGGGGAQWPAVNSINYNNQRHVSCGSDSDSSLLWGSNHCRSLTNCPMLMTRPSPLTPLTPSLELSYFYPCHTAQQSNHNDNDRFANICHVYGQNKRNGLEPSRESKTLMKSPRRKREWGGGGVGYIIGYNIYTQSLADCKTIKPTLVVAIAEKAEKESTLRQVFLADYYYLNIPTTTLIVKIIF